jgi:hypothetical protein
VFLGTATPNARRRLLIDSSDHPFRVTRAGGEAVSISSL